jgi:TolB-like protein|tara:strand:- start:656 stop:2980 length:2325 start_codon:yes stop_codon:yes gene_type:complete
MERPFPAYQGEQPYIFVSYAHADAGIVYPEIRRLQDEGFHVWWDEGISPGRRWSDELAVHVSHSALFLYFITPQSVQSQVCLDEAYLRLDESKPLLAVHLEETPLPQGLRLRLGSRQAILKHELTEPAYRDRLIKAVQDQLLPGPVSVSVTPVPSDRNAGSRLMSTGIGLLVVVAVVGSVILWLSGPSNESDVLQAPEAAVAPAAARGARSAKTPREEAARIAVLPFDNMSADPEQEYFVDGMTDAIITMLARNRGLHVIARNSTFVYKGQAVDVQQVGEALAVAYVLEGGIQKAGDAIRINVQLIDVSTESHVWADTYNRPWQNVFALQDEIAERVAAALVTEHERAELSRAKRVPTDDLSAYDAYLLGWHYYNESEREGEAALRLKAREQFERAVALDPGYADALASLGFMYWYSSVFAPGSVPDALNKAEQLAQEAKRIDNDCGMADFTLATVYMIRGQYAQALKASERAVDLMPSWLGTYEVTGLVLQFMGRYRESAEFFQKEIDLSPASPAAWTLVHLGDDWNNLGEFARAESLLNECIALYPKHPAAYSSMAYSYLSQWDTQNEADPLALERALEMAKRSVEVDSTFVPGWFALGNTYLKKRQYDLALTQVDRVVEMDPSNVAGQRNRAGILGAMGNPDLALAALDSVIRDREPEAGAIVSPVDETAAWTLLQLSSIYNSMGRPDEALAALQPALTFPSGVWQSFSIHLLLAIVHSELGNEAQAQTSAAEVLKLSPNFSVEVWGQRNPHTDQTLIQRHMAALRKAGLK